MQKITKPGVKVESVCDFPKCPFIVTQKYTNLCKMHNAQEEFNRKQRIENMKRLGYWQDKKGNWHKP